MHFQGLANCSIGLHREEDTQWMWSDGTAFTNCRGSPSFSQAHRGTIPILPLFSTGSSCEVEADVCT
ncbi:hypothetical protein CIB84_017381 [Bambusicola thoracicus]|uniref:C-type lectin domain-containing protein n=1 Tax=Bambusicola thoracicus TaxID=9083 RepID=A0A2P4S419_BAMTH|nr:hypothetical protein CIB84_017381 [Bambusicola thoracicus]